MRSVIREPVVITGVGLVTALGMDRESTWRAIRGGQTGVRPVRGLTGSQDDNLCAAVIDVSRTGAPGDIRSLPFCQLATAEALADARVDLAAVDRDRFGCSISATITDWQFLRKQIACGNSPPEYWQQWLPNSLCSVIASQHDLRGPRLSHSTACASSLISVLAAVRAIEDDQCDIALVGGADAIDPLFAAGFKKMRALSESEDPATACCPYDRNRTGFVLGEGSGMLVIERLGHALRRGAKIYAEISGGKMLAEAHHVTGLDAQSDTLTRLIGMTLDQAGLSPDEVGYINAHGTGTEQNDLVEMRSIAGTFGETLDTLCVSATKSMHGHTINAAGAIELAITALAMRDGFAPPTMNHTDPDPECLFDCLPLRGRNNRFQHALKLSVAFGGHLVAVALSRWNHAQQGFAYPAWSKPQSARQRLAV